MNFKNQLDSIQFANNKMHPPIGFSNAYKLCNLCLNKDIEYFLLTKFLENDDTYVCLLIYFEVAYHFYKSDMIVYQSFSLVT